MVGIMHRCRCYPTERISLLFDCGWNESLVTRRYEENEAWRVACDGQ